MHGDAVAPCAGSLSRRCIGAQLKLTATARALRKPITVFMVVQPSVVVGEQGTDLEVLPRTRPGRKEQIADRRARAILAVVEVAVVDGEVVAVAGAGDATG